MLIASIATNAFGIFLFLFILWKKLKEDLASEIIFKLGFSSLVGVFLGVFVSFRFLPTYFFWTSFMLGFIGLLVIAVKFKSKIFEILEAFVVAIIPWLGLTFLYDSAVHSSLSSFLAFIATLLLIFMSYYLGFHYKTFNWYKSGKIGFTGLTTLGAIFLTRLLLAIFKIPMLSLVNKFEVLFSGVSLLICFALLFHLSQIKE